MKIFVQKICGILSIILSIFLGYVFFKIGNYMIGLFSSPTITLVNCIKFFFIVIGELMLGIYSIVGIFVGFALVVDFDNED